MSHGSVSVICAASLTLLTAFGGYVSTMDAYCQAELQRLGQPSPTCLALLEQQRARAPEAPHDADAPNYATQPGSAGLFLEAW